MRSYTTASIVFIFKMVLLGAIFRFIAAVYLGLLGVSSFSEFIKLSSAFLYGWHFDLAVAGLLYLILFGGHLLFNFKPRTQKYLQFLIFLTYSWMITTDLLYVEESGRHLGYEAYNLLSIQTSVGGLLGVYWAPFTMGTAVALFLTLFHAVLIKPAGGFFKRTALLFCTLALSLVMCRGFEGIPQDPSWSYRAGGGIRGATVALNGAYSILWALFAGPQQSIRETIDTPSDFPSKEIFAKWRQGRSLNKPLHSYDGNIVIIFLEGWPGIYVNAQEGEREILPFFNKLKSESFTTDLMFAGGHRTTEGLFATLCGLPNPLGKGIMFSELEQKPFACFPQKLTEQGYSSAFFQGSDQLTSGVGPLAQKTGFRDSYGKREIPNLPNIPQNTWGVFDHTLYNFVLDKLDTMPEPVLIGINTNTTHDLALPPGEKFSFGDSSHYQQHISVVHFADSELRSFYEALTKRQWKKDWLLIVLSDHTAFAAKNIFEHYSIPFAMKLHSKNADKPAPFEDRKTNGVFSQNDVAATVADLTGLSMPTFLGRSMLRPQEFSDGASIFHLGQTAWYEGPWAMVFNIRKFGQKECFLWESDSSLKNPLPCPENAEEIYTRGLSYIKESQEFLFE